MWRSVPTKSALAIAAALVLNATSGEVAVGQSSAPSDESQTPAQQVMPGQMGEGTMPGQMGQGMTTEPGMGQGVTMVGPGMMMPSMNSAHGRRMFAEKGCVVCHSINGIGGQDAAPLDAATMPTGMNPFEFLATMWRGASAMIEMQNDELGAQIEFTGVELEDIIAFIHDEAEQRKFTEADIPAKIKAIMDRAAEKEQEPGQGDKPMNMNNMNDSP